MITEGRWNIPPSWLWVKIGEVSEIIGGGTPPAWDNNNFDSNGISWITPADLTGYELPYIFKGRRSLSERGFAISSARLLPIDTVLFSSRAPIGYCVIAGNQICTSQGFKSFIMKGGISAAFTRFYLLSSVTYAETMARGTTFKELSAARASQLLFPLAPIEEQLRITTKIESLLRKSRNAKIRLQQVLKLTEIYKYNFLGKAFKGELIISKGNSSDWTQKKLGEILINIKAGKNLRCEERPPFDNELGVLKVNAVTWGNFNPKAAKTLPMGYEPDEDAKVKPGDLLFSRANTLQLVGAVVIVKDAPHNLYLSDKILRLEMEEEVKPWLLWFLRSPLGRSALEKNATGNQESMLNISQKELRAINIPFPSLEVRESIIKSIDAAFNSMDKLVLEVKNALLRIESLNKSIFQKAFQGELVRQNENDTPIASILDSIQIEREVLKNKPKERKVAIKRDKMMEKNRLVDVLTDANDWLVAQEAFRRCGISQNATTEEIEPVFAELRALDQAGRLSVETLRDENGRKLHDKIKIIKLEDHAS